MQHKPEGQVEGSMFVGTSPGETDCPGQACAGAGGRSGRAGLRDQAAARSRRDAACEQTTKTEPERSLRGGWSFATCVVKTQRTVGSGAGDMESQEAVSFEDVAVDFTREEWALLDASQRRLFTDVMLESISHLLSTGSRLHKSDVISQWKEGEQLSRDGTGGLQGQSPVISDRKDDFKKQERTSTQRFHRKDTSLVRDMQRFPTEEDLFECNDLGENFTEILTLTPCMIPRNGEKPHIIQEFRRVVSHFDQDKPGGVRSKPHECQGGSALTRRSAARQHRRAQGGEKAFECHVCGKAFRNAANRRRHEMIHTGEKPHGCHLCGKAFTHCSDLRKHERTHFGEKPHACHLCGKAFSKSYNLRRHEVIHTREKPHGCHLCGKAFTHCSDMRKHERTHFGEKPYACHLCGKAFSKVSYLRQHERTHNQEKPHECHLCGKAFTHRSHLGKHERTHTGEKPYECRQCGKAFSDSSVLRRHSRTHTGEKPYECRLCWKAFADSSVLKRHARTHTGEKPYRCHLCGKAFTHSSVLRRHERTHTGEKPYECGLCGKAFNRSYNFALHQRIHTGEKPYKCYLCGKAFSKYFNLRQHGRTHTIRVINVEDSPPILQSSKHS
ncbi:zinc finger protein 596 isoform X2 [Phyllostomus hastatus]|uniref:zinc finger protein 596 isoform X2 n=1 Tax=Phyllostomus hastatus TaxID=9423 RepID=UPI001E685A98|nr:zinc finger protein 596 isoform X2 [Phyllostomus hastatus]